MTRNFDYEGRGGGEKNVICSQSCSIDSIVTISLQRYTGVIQACRAEMKSEHTS